jgi:tryptophan 2,3-dioxygenase
MAQDKSTFLADGARLDFSEAMSYGDYLHLDRMLAAQRPRSLVDLEDAFRRWRFRHATTVERVIGFKRGTGGTSGVSYLRRVVEVELFPELWRARTAL